MLAVAVSLNEFVPALNFLILLDRLHRGHVLCLFHMSNNRYGLGFFINLVQYSVTQHNTLNGSLAVLTP